MHLPLFLDSTFFFVVHWPNVPRGVESGGLFLTDLPNVGASSILDHTTARHSHQLCIDFEDHLSISVMDLSGIAFVFGQWR